MQLLLPVLLLLLEYLLLLNQLLILTAYSSCNDDSFYLHTIV